MRNDPLIVFALFSVAIFVVVFFCLYEILSWKECLSDHPWWFCLRILNK